MFYMYMSSCAETSCINKLAICLYMYVRSYMHTCSNYQSTCLNVCIKCALNVCIRKLHVSQFRSYVGVGYYNR